MIQKLERRFGHLGIPGLLRLVGILQIIVYVAVQLKPDLVELLFLESEKVMSGEVWRLFTFPFLPQSPSLIVFVFSLMILFFVGDSLETAWGPFRLTVYYLSSVVLLGVAAWFGPVPFIPASLYLAMSVFMAFAIVYPTQTINILGILPIQAQWLGWLDAAILVWQFYKAPVLGFAIGLGMLPLIIFAVPVFIRTLRQRSRVQARRAKFEANSLPPEDFFSKCHVCGRTDVTNPELTFRVASDDQEYCTEHMPGTTNLKKIE